MEEIFGIVCPINVAAEDSITPETQVGIPTGESGTMTATRSSREKNGKPEEQKNIKREEIEENSETLETVGPSDGQLLRNAHPVTKQEVEEVQQIDEESI